MAIAKTLPVLLGLLAATPAIAQEGEIGEVEVNTSRAMPPARVPLPRLADVRAAFDRLDKCWPASPCTTPERSYVIHKTKCIFVPIEKGLPTADCRSDMTITTTLPELRVTRYHDDCTRFTWHREAGWRITEERDAPCTAPSMLPRDPAPLPDRAQLEEELVGAFQCQDGPAEDCFIYVKSVALDSATCTRIAPDSDGKYRVACRTSGTITYTNLRRPERFGDYCLRLSRFSDRGEMPATWIFSYEDGDDDHPCEARARGTDILR